MNTIWNNENPKPGSTGRASEVVKMSLKSMTGFGRSDGTLSNIHWAWEVRSVNGRGLDVRLDDGVQRFDLLIQKVQMRLDEGLCLWAGNNGRQAVGLLLPDGLEIVQALQKRL